MLLLAALQLNILERAKNHHFLNTEINNRVGDGNGDNLTNWLHHLSPIENVT